MTNFTDSTTIKLSSRASFKGARSPPSYHDKILFRRLPRVLHPKSDLAVTTRLWPVAMPPEHVPSTRFRANHACSFSLLEQCPFELMAEQEALKETVESAIAIGEGAMHGNAGALLYWLQMDGAPAPLSQADRALLISRENGWLILKKAGLNLIST